MGLGTWVKEEGERVRKAQDSRHTNKGGREEVRGSEGGAGDGAGAWMGENWEKGSRARQSLGHTLQLSCGECTRVNTCIVITVKNLFNLPFHLPLIRFTRIATIIYTPLLISSFILFPELCDLPCPRLVSAVP